MKRLKLLISFATAFLLFIAAGVSAGNSFRPFVAKEYPPNQYKISKNEIDHGALKIKILQAKRTANASESLHYCRAWFDIRKSNKSIFSKYYDDIDPAGSSYGLFVPKSQPRAPYLAIVKTGDYDGRLFLIRNDGKVDDLLGGFYFFAKDKRYLFSNYISDSSGLAVFDLVAGKTVFSSEQLPYIFQWYEKDGTYFFTEQEWRDNSGHATEKAGIIHIYDFKKHQIFEKNISASFLKKAKIISYDSDPGQYGDCTGAPNKPLEPSR